MVTAPTQPGMWECSSPGFGGLFCYDCTKQFRKDNGIPADCEEPENASDSDVYAARLAYWDYDGEEVCDSCEKACEL